MKQLIQKVKDDEMSVLNVAYPLPSASMVLVKNHYSLISAGGTGRGTVEAACMCLMGEAKARQRHVKYICVISWCFFLLLNFKL